MRCVLNLKFPQAQSYSSGREEVMCPGKKAHRAVQCQVESGGEGGPGWLETDTTLSVDLT